MENKDRKKWYQNKWIVGVIIVIALCTAVAVVSPTDSIPTSTPTQNVIVTAPVSQPTVTTPSESGENNILSNDNSYTNVDGNQVQSPAYSENGQAPDGATAQCNDGTYSFSRHASGTCSHHGGVASWL